MEVTVQSLVGIVKGFRNVTRRMVLVFHSQYSADCNCDSNNNDGFRKLFARMEVIRHSPVVEEEEDWAFLASFLRTENKFQVCLSAVDCIVVNDISMI